MSLEYSISKGVNPGPENEILCLLDLIPNNLAMPPPREWPVKIIFLSVLLYSSYFLDNSSTYWFVNEYSLKNLIGKVKHSDIFLEKRILYFQLKEVI